MGEPTVLLSKTIAELEAFLKEAEYQVQLRQNEIKRVRFAVALLREGTETLSILETVEKVKRVSAERMQIVPPGDAAAADRKPPLSLQGGR
jgi:hypothetical protein